MAVRSKKAAATRAKTLSWRKDTASALAAILDRHDITREELAKRTGWSLDKIAFMLSGEGKVELGELCIVADAIPMDREQMIRRILAFH